MMRPTTCLVPVLLAILPSLAYANSDADALEALETLDTNADADFKPYINTVAEYNTECKVCPRSICPNKRYYSYDEHLNVTCWTRGTKIMDDTTWLRSGEGCYVTQYDLLEYDGDYTEDLEYCGKLSEHAPLNAEENTIGYKAECRITPQLTSDVVSYHPEDTDVMLVCWTDEGQLVIDDSHWLKTTQNCYVPRKHLKYPPMERFLAHCGPIPHLELIWHFNENGTTDYNKREALPTPEDTGTQYLINVTVGEEYAYCRTCPNESCRPKKRYEFDQEVWLQCLALDTDSNNTSIWWSQTTDFCYVKNTDFWESPEGDYFGFPTCDKFESPPDDDREDEEDWLSSL